MKFLKKATLILGLGLALQASVQAAPVVTDWSYTFNSVWTSASPAGVTPNLPFPNATQLSWGTPVNGGGQSSLTIILPTPPTTVQTSFPGGTVFEGVGSLVLHNNQPITGTTLLSTVLSSSINLTPINPPGLPGNPVPNPIVITSNIAFTETPNVVGDCTVGSVSVCDDIFVLTSAVQNKTVTYDGRDYLLNIHPLVGVLPLTDDACARAGVAAGCVGFVTQEGGSREMQFAFTISNNVPEPGSLALLGLGLIGLVAVRRRRQI